MRKNTNRHILSALLIIVALVVPRFVVFAQELPLVDAHVGKSNELIVQFTNDLDLADDGDVALAKAISTDAHMETKEVLTEDNLLVLEKPAGETLAQAMDTIADDPRVSYVQPNYVYHALLMPNDTSFSNQWALNNGNDADIDAPEAWDVSMGNATPPIVAVIDSGIMYEHPDLLASMWDGTNCKDENGNTLGGCVHGYNFQDGNKDPLGTTNFHGTHIAGIIAAQMNNNYAVAGVAPNAKLMALKFDLTTPGAFTTADAIRGIRFAQQNGAKIINASWGGGDSDVLLKNAIDAFPGLFVTAAGNGGDDSIGDNNDVTPMYPCNYDSPNIICVAATDSDDHLGSFSNYSVTAVDVGAPGVSILSTYSNTNKNALLGTGNGTSMAVGFVSGLAALVWGKDGSLTTAQVKNAILSTGDTLPSLMGKTLTGKRINAFAALGGTAIVPVNSFATTNVSFSSGVKKGKTKKTKLTLRFSNTSEAQAYMLSRRSDFADTSWQSAASGAKVSIKKTSKAQRFYVKFRDSNGFESQVYTKKVQYEKKKTRTIRQSKSKVRRGELLTQTGKNFSKKAQVAIYVNGAKQSVVATNASGSFATSFATRKTPGSYSWYAVDLKTGKKSPQLTYKVL